MNCSLLFFSIIFFRRFNQLCATPWRIDEVDIRGCFTEVQTMVKLLAKTGVAVTAAVAPEVPALIMSDRQRLVQVMLNLMTNAMKYTDADSVTLSATTPPPPLPLPIWSYVARIAAPAYSRSTRRVSSPPGSPRCQAPGLELVWVWRCPRFWWRN
jgi:signal transduction histidine kinase